MNTSLISVAHDNGGRGVQCLNNLQTLKTGSESDIRESCEDLLLCEDHLHSQ